MNHSLRPSRGRRATPIGLAAALFVLALGCSPPPPPGPVCREVRPQWVDRIPGASEQALFAVGSGLSSGGEGHSRNKASFDAREQLARQLRAEVSTLVRRVGKELEIEGDQRSFEAIDTFSGEQYAEQALVASAPVEFHTDDCGKGRAWVLMRLPLAGLDARIWSATAAGFDKFYADNEALLTKARALFDDAERRAALQAGLRGGGAAP